MNEQVEYCEYCGQPEAVCIETQNYVELPLDGLCFGCGYEHDRCKCTAG